MTKSIKILKTEILSDNWYVLRNVTYTSRRKDGTLSTQSREAYDRGNGAVILLYNKENKTVVLTRQFRLPTFINGNESGLLIECCAGLLDNENAEDCIKREVEEETGYQLHTVEKVMEAYMSPGSVTEILHFFIADYSAAMKVHEGGGVAQENEDIEVLELPFQRAVDMVKSGEIKDAKTILLLQYMQLHHLL
jgi:nudix-type nucleoside diphosphatase (YffH/AdpP family)